MPLNYTSLTNRSLLCNHKRYTDECNYCILLLVIINSFVKACGTLVLLDMDKNKNLKVTFYVEQKRS